VTYDGMASGRAATTSQNRRSGTSVRVTSQPTAMPITMHVAATASASPTLRTASTPVRADTAMSQACAHPTSETRTTR